MGGSSSQRRTDPPRSSINAFLIEELYTPEFLKSLQENIAYWQEPNPYEAAGERVATSPTKKKKKATLNRWRAISENSQHGNARKKDGFWCEVLAYIESKTKQEGRRTYDVVESGAGDEYYVQRAMIHYQDEIGVMDAPTIPVFAEENLGDPIDIRVNIIHSDPVAAIAFPTAAVVRTQAQHEEAIRGMQEQLLGVPIQEELTALRFRVDITEAENALLRARIKTTEAIEKITRRRREWLVWSWSDSWLQFRSHSDMTERTSGSSRS
nr:hypothetical protein [Tanacetum cinerariifolium]